MERKVSCGTESELWKVDLELPQLLHVPADDLLVVAARVEPAELLVVPVGKGVERRVSCGKEGALWNGG